MSRIERYFEDITPVQTAEQIAQGVMRKAESGAKKRSFRPLVAVAAAVAVTAAGTICVGAVSDWDFNNLFGKRIVAESEQLGYELIGDARDIVITCSDNSYDVTLNGVTGSEKEVYVSVEISRKDGKPVASYNEAVTVVGTTMWNYDKPDGSIVESSMNESSMSISNDGNIEIVLEMEVPDLENTSSDTLSNSRISIIGDNFYNVNELYGFINANENYHWKTAGDYFGAVVDYSSGGANPINIDDMALLQLEWSIEFLYTPSEVSLKSLTITDNSKPCVINAYVSAYESCENPAFPDGNYPFDVTIVDLTVKPQSAVITYKYKPLDVSLEDYLVSMIIYSADNDFFLIKEDGTRIRTRLSGANGYREDGYVIITSSLEYHERYSDPTIAVDLSDIDSFYVNGTVYPLA